MTGLEYWLMGTPLPWTAEKLALEVESMGFHGLAFPDSQNLMGDAVVAMSLAARATDRLGLMTGLTNPLTRHPAVLASALASLQVVSGGRMVLGIGRGDSSLAHIGLAPAGVRTFSDTVQTVRHYLRGEPVGFDDLPRHNFARVESLPLADQPDNSRLLWLAAAPTPVPVDVTASGPRVIAIGAVHADRITFAVGADPERVRWALARAREARAAAGMDPASLSAGAWVNVVVDEDAEAARRQGRGRLAGAARFSVMHGRVSGEVSQDDRTELEGLAKVYGMAGHGESGGAQADWLSDRFADRFGIFGAPSYCVERLRQLRDLGLDRLMVMPPGGDVDPDNKTARRLADEILPELS